ncbi:MAG: hypothetical protein KGJ02_04000 [Verrucomicrobiota bacterium]|nr:hypothetical protein [Verrucomicrobiota bacterium]
MTRFSSDHLTIQKLEQKRAEYAGTGSWMERLIDGPQSSVKWINRGAFTTALLSAGGGYWYPAAFAAVFFIGFRWEISQLCEEELKEIDQKIADLKRGTL